ncbi:MAG: type II toxin-antitoxin system PemK/MazF family toxin [Candidatus Aminicenantes bacterium]|nr:type II toxin-antitoxin system PemK/MazF family toxin [Candidatus Aminicenantes bacterium]
MNRGDIYWVNLDPTAGSEIRKTRPCVIISANPINKARRTVVVIPLSSAGTPNPPLVIEVDCLGRKALAVCDQIRAIDKSRLVNKVDSLSGQDLDAIENGLRQVLCLY